MDLGLLPRRCAVCDRPPRTDRRAGGLCPACIADLVPADALPVPPGLDDCVSLLRYEGATTRLVAALKFRNHRDALPELGRALAALLEPVAPVDVATWAPTSAARARRRGFDQAELLARRVGRAAVIPVRGLLVRDPGPPQTGRDREHRLHGPSFRHRRRVTGHVVVVDDVRTTGATLSAAAATLRSAGADRVTGLTLAVRP